MDYYIKVLKNYAVFEGRASRKEYWMFALFNFIFSFVYGFVVGFIGAAFGLSKIAIMIVGQLYAAAVLVPNIAVAVRRAHDADYSGWYVIAPIFNIIMFCMKGTEGENRFGTDPYAAVPSEVVSIPVETPQPAPEVASVSSEDSVA